MVGTVSDDEARALPGRCPPHGGGRRRQPAEALQDAAVDLMPQAQDAGVFVAAARKAIPAAALFHGLGARNSALLPGWFDDFLLVGAEVAAALPRAARALDASGPRRDEAISRVTTWVRDGDAARAPSRRRARPRRRRVRLVVLTGTAIR
ncbi:hypothetical protein [Streptomyces sp. NPDC001070]